MAVSGCERREYGSVVCAALARQWEADAARACNANVVAANVDFEEAALANALANEVSEMAQNSAINFKVCRVC